MVNDGFIDESVLTTGRYISVVATALKKQNTFVWDEEQASDNNKEYAEPIQISGDVTWEISDCTKEIKPPINGE